MKSVLCYSARFSVVLKYFGYLLLIFFLLSIPPFFISCMFQEWAMAVNYSGVLIISLCFGYLFSRIRAPEDVQFNEVSIVICSMFLFAPLAMAFPLMGSGMNFEDALFECVSGVTTTGLSILEQTEQTSKTVLFSRAWMQWYSGFGIMIFSLALIFKQGILAKRLSISEESQKNLIGGTRAKARYILYIYVGLTLFGLCLLMLLDGRFFNSMLLIFSSVSTGGFSPYQNSIASLNFPAQACIIGIGFLCAISFALFDQLFHKKWKMTLDSLQFLVLFLLCCVISLGIVWTLMPSEYSLGEIFRLSSVVAFSAQTTAGFSPMEISLLEPNSKLILIFSMIIGGGLGSTAGGFKIIRLVILWAMIRTLLFQANKSEHAYIEPELLRTRFSNEGVYKPLIIILLFFIMISISWLIFVSQGYDPLDSLFDVASAAGTVGLSTGICSPKLPVLLKGVLGVNMLLGRLEIFPWLLMFFPKTWIGEKRGGL